MPAPLLALLSLACTNDDYARVYHTEPIAPSLNQAGIEGLDYMGPVLTDKGVNFSVYSERATRIELLLFDDPEDEWPIQQFEMERFGDVWSVYVEGVGAGQHYNYVAWGPNWEWTEDWFPGSIEGFEGDVDAHGNRFNPNKALLDPWAKAVHRDHDWGRGFAASGPWRTDSTWGAAARSVVVESDYEWSANEAEWIEMRKSGDHPGHDWADLILYEVSPRGFTANSASGVTHPGTFQAIGEMAAYLQDLGINAIELMPIHEKPSDGGYWGYNNISFFAPELDYSASYQITGEPYEVIDEFKAMVDVLHQHDIEVIVDVVYNHTGEGGLWRDMLFFGDGDGDGLAADDGICDPGDGTPLDTRETATIVSYRGLDNAAWYALDNANQEYWDGTGVGNAVRDNHTPGRRLILDSLRFMVEELHVDGFRFDLAPILGVEDLNYGNFDPEGSVLKDIIDDPVLQAYNARIIAEPWAYGAWGVGRFPASSDGDFGWGEWNPYFRDFWRSFLNEGVPLNYSAGGPDGGGVMTGSYDLYADNGRKPFHSVNFVTVHDGFTLYDLFSYGEKQNGCGLLNSVCCYDSCSAWCEPDSGESHNRSLSWGTEHEKRQMMRNMFTAMMFSYGTPLILGGDEWMRTQYGNNNAWGPWSDNEWNWFRWGEWQNSTAWHRHRMHDFVSQITRMRKERPYAFAPREWGGDEMTFQWKSASGGSTDWDGRNVMMHYSGGGHPDLVVLINMEDYEVEFSLPGGTTWGRLVDTQPYFDLPGNSDEISAGYTGYFSGSDDDLYTSANITLDDPEIINESRYGLPAMSIAIFEAQ